MFDASQAGHLSEPMLALFDRHRRVKQVFILVPYLFSERFVREFKSAVATVESPQQPVSDGAGDVHRFERGFDAFDFFPVGADRFVV